MQQQRHTQTTLDETYEWQVIRSFANHSQSINQIPDLYHFMPGLNKRKRTFKNVMKWKLKEKSSMKSDF